MNIVFLVPEWPASQRNHVKALLAMGCRVFGISSKPADQIDPEMRGLLAGYEPVKSSRDPEEVLAAVRRIAAKERIDRIECTMELQMYPAAVAREALGLPGPSSKTILLCRDKYLMKQHLLERGIQCARVANAPTVDDARRFADLVGYPIIIKPLDLASSIGIVRVDKADALEKAYGEAALAASGQPLAVEEFVQGIEGMFDTLVCNGEVVFDVICHYYPNVLEAKRTRWISPITTITNRMEEPTYKPLREFGRRVIKELELTTTATHMEWFHAKNGGLYFGEIGARPPGDRFWDLYNWANDFDLYAEWAKAVMHGKCEPKPSRKYSAGMVAVRADRDGTVKGYAGVEDVKRRCKDCIVEMYLVPVGQPAPGVGEADLFHSYIFLRHPDYDECKAMLEYAGKTLKVKAG